MTDPDGIAIPPKYRTGHRALEWAEKPLNVRRMIASTAQSLAGYTDTRDRDAREFGTGAPNYTTAYAIAWGRSQGWTLAERERYDYRLKRHHDVEGFADAAFYDQHDQRVLVQAAGKAERAKHYAKFELWGGPAKAKRRGIRVLYVVFERSSKEPLTIEEWA